MTIRKIIQKIQVVNPYLLLFFLFIGHLLFYWPGILEPDSATQYLMAKNSVYSDHHPFIMSWLWHYLDLIYSGSGLMFLLQLLFIFSSLWIFILISPKNNRHMLLLMPFMPQVAYYSMLILKDIQFAYAFCFAISCTCYFRLTRQDKSINYFLLFISIIALAYGSLAKYQGQFLAPIVLFFLGASISHNIKEFIYKTLAVFTVFYTFVFFVVKVAPPVNPDHSWQYVKLYDLSSISLDSQQDLIPDEFKTDNFSMEKWKQTFNHTRVDEMVFGENVILKKNVEASDLLLASWRNAIFDHPIWYLKHRLYNFSYAALSLPGFTIIKTYVDENITNASAQKLILYFMRFIMTPFFAYITVVLGSFLYLFLALLTLRKSPYAWPLMALNVPSLAMAFIIFFMSMAGTPRYLYISACLFHLSHGFAFACYRAYSKQAQISSN